MTLPRKYMQTQTRTPSVVARTQEASAREKLNNHMVLPGPTGFLFSFLGVLGWRGLIIPIPCHIERQPSQNAIKKIDN